jgi:hypothetical protein
LQQRFSKKRESREVCADTARDIGHVLRVVVSANPALATADSSPRSSGFDPRRPLNRLDG